ncbi:MAG: hypothetical protein IJU76_02060 [Desulfovibrionaceae bacterium]|nr:hypothetical protein [Desulfovibrionaceae bacterium]
MAEKILDSGMQALLDWLTERYGQIHGAEEEAKSALARGDTEEYAAKLTRKAELLADLPKDARPYLLEAPEAVRGKVLQKLTRFSQSAAYGLKLKSTFFMSALLYRDDHAPGEPDNFSVFLSELTDEAKAL